MDGKIDEHLTRKVAKLARLNLSKNEIKKFTKDMKDILDAFRILDTVNTDNVKPTFHPIEIKNRFRDDNIEESLSQKEALSNSHKNKENGFFKGPKIV